MRLAKRKQYNKIIAAKLLYYLGFCQINNFFLLLLTLVRLKFCKVHHLQNDSININTNKKNERIGTRLYTTHMNIA